MAETRLYPIGKNRENATIADVIFVHGLFGGYKETWHPENQPRRSWPQWLSAELPRTKVWSLSYPAGGTRWTDSGSEMALHERARDIITCLVSSNIGDRPLFFITHSLGGLLVKQVLRIAKEFGIPEWQNLVSQTKGVIFIACPHSGSHLANFAEVLKLFRPTPILSDLKAHCPHLADLGTWYRQNAPVIGIETLAFNETKKYPKIKKLVVNATSADPGVPNCILIPCEADHITICKPSSKKSRIYSDVKFFLENCMAKKSFSPSPRKVETNISSEYIYDLFISYRCDNAVEAWVEKYLYPDLFERLRDELPYVPKIFCEKNTIKGEKRNDRSRDALKCSRMLLPVLTTPYFGCPFCIAELDTILAREECLGLGGIKLTGGLIYPVKFSDGDYFREDIRRIEQRNMKKWALHADAFKETRMYVGFQSEVQHIAEDVVLMIKKSPPFDPTWPVIEPGNRLSHPAESMEVPRFVDGGNL